MDDIRQIRLLIPPVFFILAVLLGAYLKEQPAEENAPENPPTEENVAEKQTAEENAKEKPLSDDVWERLATFLDSAVHPKTPNTNNVATLVAVGGSVAIVGGLVIGLVTRILLVVLLLIAYVVRMRRWKRCDKGSEDQRPPRWVGNSSWIGRSMTAYVR